MRSDRSRCNEWMRAVTACVSTAALIAMIVSTVTHAASVGGPGTPPPSAGSSGAGPGRGVPATGSPTMKAPSQPVLPSEKKPIHITPEVLGGITQALLKTDTIPAKEELKAALKEAESKLSSVSNELWYYQNYAKTCSNKTYTTEDQKQAGCLGTDTLNQCSQKLFRHCFDQAAKYKKQGFSNSRKKMYEAADRLEKASKAYTEKLKLIPIFD